MIGGAKIYPTKSYCKTTIQYCEYANERGYCKITVCCKRVYYDSKTTTYIRKGE